MGRLFKAYLGGGLVYRCAKCRTHLTMHQQLVSKAFQGRHGKAYLFAHVVNVTKGPSEIRDLTTGRHTVRDIFCMACEELVGWYYEAAQEESQKYKVHKFILEKARIIKQELL